MPADREAAATLREEIDKRQSQLKLIEDRHTLRLPSTGYGRMSVDDANEADERMARMFGEPEEGDEQ